jgi:glycerol-3-phosphate dehydrogenase
MVEFQAAMPTADVPRQPVPEGPFDLVVAGGGINGVAIARDAVLRGHSVALFEKGDIGGGTSSSSSKMIHGGIRYLEQLRLGLVQEALQERHLLLRLAPHLVRPQSFIIPLYEGARRGPRWVKLGLFLYDLLALGRRPGKSRFLSPEEVLARVPELRPEGLLGGGLYYDAVVDDARLCLLNAVAAREEAKARSTPFFLRSRVEVVACHYTTPLRVTISDAITGRRQEILTHRLVRALGPWTDPELLVPSKGVHLVLPRFPGADGLLMTHSQDGRAFFLIPWKGLTVVGTTETPFEGSPEGLRVEAAEVEYLFSELRRLFPRIRFTPADLLGVFAGVRPLARERGLLARLLAWRTLGRRGTGSVSRKHCILDDGKGIWTVCGGKLTTYRAVARRVVDRLFGSNRCETDRLPLPGGEEGGWEEHRARRPASAGGDGADEKERERLFQRYGCRYREVLRLQREDPALAAPLGPGYRETRAEVLYCIRNEFVLYPEDFLARRTTLRYSADGGLGAYDAVEEMVRSWGRPLPPDLEAARERYVAERAWEAELRQVLVKA